MLPALHYRLDAPIDKLFQALRPCRWLKQDVVSWLEARRETRHVLRCSVTVSRLPERLDGSDPHANRGNTPERVIVR